MGPRNAKSWIGTLLPTMVAMRSVEAMGRRITFNEIGAGPPLICIPGGPGFPGAHLGDLGGLHKRHRLILMNTRGVRGTTPGANPSEYAVDDYVEDVAALRQGLNLDRLCLYGHSHGGIVAVRYAARYPEHLRALIIDGTPLRHLELPDRIEAMFADWDTCGREYLEASLAERYEDAADHFFEQEWPTLDLSLELSQIRVPTLVIVGRKDPAASATATEMSSLLPAGELAVVEGAGHFAWVERPVPYAAAIERFLHDLS